MNRDLAEWFDECLAGYYYRIRPRWKAPQKRRAIELILRANPHRSDRSIAAETGFSRELVTSIRRRLPVAEVRIGLDGKRYRSNREPFTVNRGP